MDMPDTQSFMDALTDRHWPLVAAFGVMILIWVFRNFLKEKLPKKYLPYAALAVSVLTAAASRIIQAVSMNHTWWHGMIQGILEGATIGLSSMGMWSSGGKKLPVKSSE